MCSLLFGGEFLISYSYVVRDAVIYNEEFFLSRAMTKCRGREVQTSLLLPYKKDENLKTILLENYDEFFSYLEKLGLHVEHKSLTKRLQNTSTTKLTFPTTCFKVDFNDNFVTITAIK